jgi:hypothetical protein
MTENYKKVTKAAHARNRKVRYQARKQVEDRITNKLGGTPSAREKAKVQMKGKDVHKTPGGQLRLIDHAAHGEKHGRGHRGKPRAYRNK